VNTPDADAQLAACFQQARIDPPMDPFVGDIARRIAVVRTRRRYIERAALIAGVAALVLCSHWLIEASVIASAKLDVWFAVGLGWLATPLGTSAVVAGGIATVAALRLRAR
jgi:hypothetical protein